MKQPNPGSRTFSSSKAPVYLTTIRKKIKKKEKKKKKEGEEEQKRKEKKGINREGDVNKSYRL